MHKDPSCELYEPLERKRFEKPDAQVWVENGTLYVMFRREQKPDIPFPTLPAHRQSPRRVSIQQMIKLDWIRNGYEYLAFIPTSIPYNNSLLLRFWLDEPNMPIKVVEVNSILTTYFLQPVWTDNWKDFEVVLLHSAEVLMLRAGVCSTICKPPRPSCRRLDDKFRSREEAVRNVYETRRRFLPWLGLFSYLVALLDGTGTFRMKTGQIEKWPVWQGTLLIHGVLPHTVKTMGDSILGSFHPSFKRVGTVIDYQSDPHALHVGMMADRNVPVIYGVPLNRLHELPMSYQEGNFFKEFHARVNPSGSLEDMKKLLRKYLPPDGPISRESAIERTQGISMLVSSSLMTGLENLTQTQLWWMTSRRSILLRDNRSSRRGRSSLLGRNRKTGTRSVERERRQRRAACSEKMT